MSLVIITGDGPEHHYVANHITAAHDVTAILVCDPPVRRSWKSILRKGLGGFLSKAARQVYLRMIKDQKARSAQLEKVFGPGAVSFERSDLVHRVGRPKSGELARVVAELKPDVLAIYGTGIIPDNVLTLTGQVALNMHTGLSPDYRGVACAFWPLHDSRPDMVGATVHECTADVDGGLIYQKATATLECEDHLHMIFGRAVQAGAKAYVSVISHALEGILQGTPQDLSQGREYRGAQLGLRAELRTRYSLRQLKRNGQLTRSTHQK